MQTEIWVVDRKRSDIKFTLRHLIVAAISGHVGDWRATLRIDPEAPARSGLEAVLAARSIDTGDAERDDHIRSAEFLDVATFPEIVFRGHRAASSGPGRYSVDGELTLRDVTRPVSLDVEDLGRTRTETGQQAASFRARASFNRQHFGLHWNQDLDTGGVVLGDKVEVEIVVEAVLDQVVADEPPTEIPVGRIIVNDAKG